MGAIRHVAVNENVVCASDLHLAACHSLNDSVALVRRLRPN